MAKKNVKRIKVLVPNLAGKYSLPYAKNEVIEIEEKQADELIDAGDAKEYSKATEAKEKKELKDAEAPAENKEDDSSEKE